MRRKPRGAAPPGDPHRKGSSSPKKRCSLVQGRGEQKEIQALRAHDRAERQKADQRRAHDLANQAGKLETKLKSALLKLEEQTVRVAETRRELAAARKEATAAARRTAKAESALERAKATARNVEPVKELTPQPRPAERAIGAEGKKPTPKKRVAKKKIAKKPAARRGPADDLKRIAGIGPSFEKALHKAGVRHFGDLAAMRVADLEALSEKIDVPVDRMRKGKWVENAKRLAKQVAPSST